MYPKTKFVANFIGDANVVKAEIINQNNNIYEIQLAEMKINIESDQKLESSVSVSLRPEKITISKSPEENSIHASVNNIQKSVRFTLFLAIQMKYLMLEKTFI